jgi:hypothetical protein
VNGYNPEREYTIKLKARDLVPFYNDKQNGQGYLHISRLCDGLLDKSGALLGYVRALSLSTDEKTS